MSKFSELIAGHTPVLVDVYATWCGPCTQLEPIIKQLANQYSGKLKVIKIDIDKNQSFAQKHGIQGVPTLMLYKSGNMVWRQSGALPKHAIEEQIQQVI